MLSRILTGDKVKKKKNDDKGAIQESKVTHTLCDINMTERVTGKESGKSGFFHISSRLWDYVRELGKKEQKKLSTFVGWSIRT